MDSTKPDVITGCESKLDASMSSAEGFPPNFIVYRKDRNCHGGVFIAVRDNIQATHRNDLDSNCEAVWVEIPAAGDKPLIIGSCYFPPDAHDASSSESINQLSNSMKKIKHLQKKHILVCGDFNQPGINWKSHAVSIKSIAGAKLIQVAEENDLHQCVKTPMRCTECCQNILDLLFTNQPLSIDNVLVIQGFSDHDAITASIRMKA